MSKEILNTVLEHNAVSFKQMIEETLKEKIMASLTEEEDCDDEEDEDEEDKDEDEDE